MKVLITSGATREPLDAVRFITNLSSGYTGQTLAETFSERGHEVVFVHGAGSLKPAARIRPMMFADFADLNQRLLTALREESFDWVIHSAAVSDYSVVEITTDGTTHLAPIKGKMSSGQEIEVKLRRNFKIVDRLKSYSQNPKLGVVAFKLTDGADAGKRADAVAKLNAGSVIDYVVHNDLTERISPKNHAFTISTGGDFVAKTDSARDLGIALERLLRRDQ